MTRERRISNPYDFSFGLMYNEFPKELHENLNLPGIFNRKSNVKVRMKDGRTLEMDASYIVDPDFKTLFEPAVVDLEHQSQAVDIPKIQTIGEYNIQQTADERLPTLNIVASHINEKYSVKEFERTPTNITRLLFVNLGAEDNEKRLNKVSTIINTNEKQLSINEALELGIILVFAPRDKSCEITRQVAELYVKIKNKPPQLEYVLYGVISAMIDAYFDDEKEYEELMNMINNETGKNTVEKFETEIIRENKLKEANQRVKDVNQKLKEANQSVKEANQRLKELEKENNRLKTKLNKFEKK